MLLIPDATIQEVAAKVHFPSVELLVHGYGAMLQAVIDEATYKRLITDVTAALQSYVDGEELLSDGSDFDASAEIGVQTYTLAPHCLHHFKTNTLVNSQ